MIHYHTSPGYCITSDKPVPFVENGSQVIVKICECLIFYILRHAIICLRDRTGNCSQRIADTRSIIIQYVLRNVNNIIGKDSEKYKWQIVSKHLAWHHTSSKTLSRHPHPAAGLSGTPAPCRSRAPSGTGAVSPARLPRRS